MKYTIDRLSGPAYLQIYKYLRNDIIEGIYPYDSKLPSKRMLAAELGVSTITIEHAYELLCDEGYAKSKERSGYVVIFRPTDGFAVPVTTKNHIQTEYGSPDNSGMSASILSKTIRRVLNDYREVMLEKSPNTGCVKLREAIRAYLARNRGIHVNPEQIVIGSGAEYLYGLIIDLLGRDKTYAIENPCYDKLEKIYCLSGVTYEKLPLAEDGIESMALSSTGADILHTTPYCSYPSGITASASKRHEYIRWASKNNRIIIESDYGSEFFVSSQPMETLFVLSDNDNIIYLNTFSKTISPSMRIGYMVLPQRLVAPFQKKLGFYSCSVPTIEQYLLTELLDNGDFERHINRVRRNMRRELDDEK